MGCSLNCVNSLNDFARGGITILSLKSVKVRKDSYLCEE
jgi:hypothetical protein